MNGSLQIMVSWVCIDLDILDKVKSHFTGKLRSSCISFHMADIFVYITLVLPCYLGTLFKLIVFDRQLVFLCLILFKKSDAYLFVNLTCYLVLIHALYKTVKLRPYALQYREAVSCLCCPEPHTPPLFVCKELCPDIGFIHYKVDLLLNILKHKDLNKL